MNNNENMMNFSFNFDEVFEGIKCGVVKEMSEMNFEQVDSEEIVNMIIEECYGENNDT